MVFLQKTNSVTHEIYHESHQRGEATFVLFNLVSSNFHYQNRNTEITRPVPGHIPLLLQSRC